jgi:hypothetical protein
MKFSEAMLLGLPEIKFTNGAWLYSLRDKHSTITCSGCLVGAALYAIGRREDVDVDVVKEIVQERWPWTTIFTDTWFLCPGCGTRHCLDITGLMTHLACHYDQYRQYPGYPQSLSAEQIADFIRLYEPEEVEAQQKVEAKENCLLIK